MGPVDLPREKGRKREKFIDKRQVKAKETREAKETY
jgi:hypothetical protein